MTMLSDNDTIINE